MTDNVSRVESWAIVELMGRQRIAGFVSERVIAGAGMLQIDVPAVEAVPAFTRFVAPAAVYAINPCSEEIARGLAARLQERPIQAYEIKALPGPLHEEACGLCLATPCVCDE